MINRTESAVTRERSEDVMQVHRNLDPTLHPFERAREYTRAVNAAKTERMFAKPFIAALTHDEAVYCLARNPVRLNCVMAGCGDGLVRLWDIPDRRCATKSLTMKIFKFIRGKSPLCAPVCSCPLCFVSADVCALSGATPNRFKA